MNLACPVGPTVAKLSLKTNVTKMTDILVAREQFLLNMLPGSSDAYKRTCIYIILKLIQSNRDISTNNLSFQTRRFGYDEAQIENYLNALNLTEFRLVRWWKNKRQRRTGYRFWVIEDYDLYATYMDYLTTIHPELKAAEIDLNLRKGI